MDRALEVTALGRASGMVTATGTSEIVGLRVADILALEGLNFVDSSDRHVMGHYDIVGITHSFDHSGHYQNRFEAVPADTPHPPCSDGFAAAFAPDQRGRVLDNADPQGLGRVRVQFPWQVEITQSTPWIKTPTPYGGSGKGFYFVPEKGEEVLVGFEGGDPEKPYVIGGGYNVSAKSGFADSENNIKAIRTRSGHTIELIDTEKEEEIHIYNGDKKNMIVLSSKDENIRIVSEGDIVMQGKNIQLTAEENIRMEAKEKGISLKANENISAESDGIKLKATKAIVAEGEEVTLDAKNKVALEGGSGVDVTSPKTKIQGNISKLEII
ncbi:MAG: phage baseplate assembly protein V [Pricia sp.]